ncbi:MAG: hypothetical protein JST31_14360 [Actinobacteria bacterium]|nr:hypothetical protein [Actinomycetota bacterium]
MGGGTDTSEDGAEPLALAVLEFRWDGIALAIAGFLFGIAAVVAERPLRAVLILVFFAAPFGLMFYLVVIRKMVARAAAGAAPLSDVRIEDVAAMRRRILRTTGIQIAGGVVIALVATVEHIPGLAIGGGALLGIGGGMLAASQWFAGWQEEQSATLFRRPAYRWRRDPKTGRRGGGVMDPRDFFVLRSARTDQPR